MDFEQLIFLPYPRKITPLPGVFRFGEWGGISIDPNDMKDLLPAAQKLRDGLTKYPGLNWQIELTAASKVGGISIRRTGDHSIPPQGYLIKTLEDGIQIDAADAAGAYYASCTLLQMLEQLPAGSRVLPGISILDWPDFAARGVMLDISRDKVYTMETLFELVDLLSSWKINQLQLYMEHTFAYQNHPIVWQDASPMTAGEIRQLDVYCKDRFVELVPNQNSFGHMERWLKYKEYEPLAEIVGDFVTPWGEKKTGPYSLAAVDPGSIKLIASLYDELLPNFSSSLFNVGCDETFDLGKGRSRDACERLGIGRVYLDYLLQIHQLVVNRGNTMQFWGDIILKYPELLPEIPRDVLGLTWGYEADHPFDHQAELFSRSGLPFYVCPGTSTWNSLAGRTDNALENIHNAARNGLRFGAAGCLVTDWGDNGHWQMLPVSYLGFVSGAALSWCVDANQFRSVPDWLDTFAFQDRGRILGDLAFELGNADHTSGVDLPGNGGYFWPLQWPLEKIRSHPKYNPRMFLNGIQKLQEIREKHAGYGQMLRKDAQLIQSEFDLTMRMMQHACQRALFAFGKTGSAGLRQDLEEIITEYRRIWLLRNRVGGLHDSLSRLEMLRCDYE